MGQYKDPPLSDRIAPGGLTTRVVSMRLGNPQALSRSPSA